MSAILKLVQGSNEWHQHRAKSRNASETPIVMGLSPFETAFHLWLVKTGRAEQKVTAPMIRGTELEPAARAAYEEQTGNLMEALVVQDGDYSASLDGTTLAGDLVLEIKCPMKGRDSDLWKAVESGQVPEHYCWQIEHQLMVSGAQRAHLWVFDGKDGLLAEIPAAPDRWPEIHLAWDEFMKYLESDTPPPLSDRDTRTREDAEWRDATAKYIAAKQQAEVSAAALEEARTALVALASHPSESGFGVTVSQFFKRGSVDYKRVPALKGVDLEQYRAQSRMETRVSVA